jgi:hypothetical protein
MFADPKVAKLLREEFVPVALDVWYEQRRNDRAGAFFRAVAAQRPDYDPERTAQGLYVCTPRGDLVYFTNHRDPGRLRGALDAAYREARRFEGAAGPARAEAPERDPEYERRLPEGARFARVYARVLEGRWRVEKVPLWDELRRQGAGRDHLWILAPEIEALRRGEVAPSLARRIARFHLVDNTRGEPPMWAAGEVLELALRARAEGEGRLALSGHARLVSKDGARGYDAALAGSAEFDGAALARLELFARGAYRGCGPYTGDAPESPFTVAVAFVLAPEGDAPAAPPQGARSLRDYLAAP